jgi:VWFA-related protein
MDTERRASPLSRFLSRVFVLSLCLLTSISPLNQVIQAATQSGSSQPAPMSPVISISVRNQQGAPADLAAADLEVKINGTPASVREVQSLGRPTLRYCLLLDSSGSQRKRWQQHADEAITLLRIMQAGRDYGLLVAFNDEPYLDAEGTDPQKIMRAVSKVDARNGTALYDAMIACSNSLADSASPSDLRVMFILSDGDDNASRHNREQALQSLVKSGIRVYAIGERNVEDPWPAVAVKGIDALKRFAEKTGGKAYISKSGNDVQSAVTDISSQLSSVFSVSLGSTPPLPGDSVFKVEVKCRAKKVSLNAPQEFFVPLH